MTDEEILHIANTKTPEEIVSDRKFFDSFIYTDIDHAIKELHRRREDPELEKKVREFFGDIPIPEPLKDPKLIMFRQVATPNYETSRFLMASDSVGIDPVFFEYLEDIFHPGNYAKKYLGKLAFHEGFGKKNGPLISYENIIDFNKSNGKPFSKVETFFNRSLPEIHHDFFSINYKNLKQGCFFDASEWFEKSGNTAEKYYPNFFTLFLKNAILFENFMINDEIERHFSKEIIIHSFLKVYNYFGIKPLIVALEPTDIEGDIFWECHNLNTKNFLEKMKEQNGHSN